MSSLARMLAILDLFTDTVPVMSADDIAATLGYSRPTGFRYVRELVATGLLVRMPDGCSLGPRIIELDWHIRRFDRVLAASRPIVAELARQTECNVTQMWMYGERIVTIAHESPGEPLAIGFDRGRPMPLFRGAPSRAIIAYLPRARLERLYDRHRDEISPAQRRQGFAKLYERLQQVRRAGIAVSLGELDPDKVGIAAPLRLGGTVSGSLCLVLTATRYATSNQTLLAEMLIEFAGRIDLALESSSAAKSERSRPRRARDKGKVTS